MTDPAAPTTCWHPSIHVSRNEEHDITVWACEDCRRRFYPACEQCVSIGHREGHGEHIEARSTPAEALDVERLARAIEIEDDRLPFLDGGIDSTASPRAVAEQIADRYARLRSPESDR